MAANRRGGKTPRSESTSLGGTLDAAARKVLIAARHSAHVTQKELAQRLERPPTYISDLERGTHLVHRSDFIAYAHALGADPHVLFARVFASVPERMSRSVRGQRRRKAG